MADQQIKTELVGDAGGLLGVLAKASEGVKGFAETVKSKFEAAGSATSKYSGELKTMEGRVASLREEYLKLKTIQTSGGGGDLIGAQVKGAEQALAAASRELNTFKAHAAAATEETKPLGTALKDVAFGGTSIEGAMASMGGPVGIAVALLTGLAAAAAGAVVWLAEITKHTAEAADEAGKTAQKVGLSTQAWTELKYSADLADVSEEGLEKGLGQLAKNMQQAVWSPDGPAGKTLESLGVKAADAHGNLRPLEDVLGDVAEQFERMPDGPRKTADAMNLFGKSGKDLIPFLNEGKAHIAEMRKEAEALGVTFTREDAKAAESFQDNSKRLDLVLQGLKNTIGKDLLPEFVDLAQGAIDFAKVAIPYVVTGIHYMATAFYSAIQVSDAFIDRLVTDGKNAGTIITTLFQASAQANRGQLGAAKDTLEKGWNALKQNEEEHNAFLVFDAQETANKITKIWAKIPDAPVKPDTSSNEGGGKKGDNAGLEFVGWTKAEQTAMDKLAEIRRKSFEEFRQMTGAYYQGQAQLREQQIGFEEKDTEEAFKKGEISNTEYIRRMQAFENEKFQIQAKALNDRAALLDAEPVRQQEVFNQLDLLAQAHSAKMVEIQKHTDQSIKQEGQGLANFIRSLSSNLANGLVQLVTTSGSLLTRLGGFFKSMADMGIRALAELTSKTLIWKAVTIAANAGVISSENARRAATLLGITADHQAAAASTSKAAASEASVGPTVSSAAAKTFEANSFMPIVGAIIAGALVLYMLATMSKVRGRAVGGLVDKPELTLLGEAGPEVVAPERDFKDWAGGLLMLGNLGANVAHRQAQVESLNRTAAGYARANPREQALQVPDLPSHTIQVHFNGPIWDSSNRGMQQLGRHVIDASRQAARQLGVVLQPGQTFGGL